MYQKPTKPPLVPPSRLGRDALNITVAEQRPSRTALPALLVPLNLHVSGGLSRDTL